METTLQGLNITVAGMGLVFLALAIVMVAIVGLDRLFPGETAGAGDRAEALPPPAAAVAPGPPPGASRLQASVGDKSFLIEAREPAGKVRQFAVGDRVFKVERSKAAIGEVLIDGEPYRVDVLSISNGSVKVKLGDRTMEVKLAAAAAPAAPPPVAAPAAAAGPVAQVGVAVGRAVPAPLPGKILRVNVAIGDRVKVGQELCVLEAMKMENVIKAQADGVVRHVVVQPGQSVSPGETLMWVE